jgi:hypothetical protein
MPEVNATITWEIWCAKCGAPLCGNVSCRRSIYDNRFDIEPCEKCLDAARNEGYEEGQNDQ